MPWPDSQPVPVSRKILVIHAHPDASPERLASALADAYVRGAEQGGHQVRRITLADASFPPVLNTDSVTGVPPAAVAAAQQDFLWADHVTIIFPLWLAAPPALMKGFFEQLWRYGFAFDEKLKPLLKGRTARLIVTMLLPTPIFHLLFAQGVKGFVRGVLWSSGIKPTRITPIGNVMNADKARWLDKIEMLGRRGA